MKKLLVAGMVLMAGSVWGQSYPVTKYNPMENRFEITYPESNLMYNPYSNKFHYVTPRYPGELIVPQYNPMENKFQFPDTDEGEDDEDGDE